MTELTFNADAPRAFLTAVFNGPKAAAGLIELVHDDESNKHLTGRHRSSALTQIDQVVAKAADLTAKHRRVYFGAGVRSAQMPFDRPSLDSDVTAWPALVWDCDNLEASTYCLEKAKELDLGFHFVVQTGQFRNNGKPDLRVQCWVLLSEPCYDLDRVKRVLKRGIQVFGSDKSIHDSRRVVRLPGSISWGLKDGRQSEPVVLRDDLAEIRGRYTIEELETILDGAEVAPVREVNQERVTEIRERIVAEGSVTAIWRDSPYIDVCISDLLDGHEMNPSLFQLAVSAARDGHPGEGILAALQELLSQSDGIVQRPERVAALERGLPRLVQRALMDAGLGPGAVPYRPAVRDFPEIEPGLLDEEVELDARERMFARFVYVTEMDQVFDLKTRKLLTKSQFNMVANDVGRPADARNCAWAVYSASHPTDHPESPGFMQVAAKVTYRPGAKPIVIEPDGARAVNKWGPSPLKPASMALDEDVRMWTNHVLNVCSAEGARHFFDYFAFLLQNPHIKINHAILVKSAPGVGKNMMVLPIEAGVGSSNYIEVGPGDVGSDFNPWLDGKKLVVVDEMQTTAQRDQMNKMKNWIAAPPHTLRINEKGQKVYSIPNLVSMLFFSNLDAPVKLEPGDRRFYIIDSTAAKKEPEYYAALAAWYKNGGFELVARWLLDRDVSAFNPNAGAPMTDAKAEMTRAGRAPLEEWLADCLEAGVAPLDSELVSLPEVAAYAQEALRTANKVTGRQVAAALRSIGGDTVSDLIRFTPALPKSRASASRLAAVRRPAFYIGLSSDLLRKLALEQWSEAAAKRATLEFAADAAQRGSVPLGGYQ